MRKISENLSVAPQIEVDDVPSIAAAGFRSIVCNRPDREESGQTSSGEIEAAAKAAGLSFAYLPVISGMVEDAQGAAFGDLMARLPGPVLAYCRSGTRCAMLWSLAQAKAGQDTGPILAAAAGAGYDLRGLAPRLERLRNG